MKLLAPILFALGLTHTPAVFSEENPQGRIVKVLKKKKVVRKISDEELKSLQAGLGNTQQIKADFTLTQTRRLRKTPVVRKGTSQFGIPNKFVWHIKNSPEVVQYFNGKNFVQYYPKNKLAQQIKPTGEMHQTITRLVDVVLDWSALKESYDFQSANWVDKDAHIVLAPKDSQSKLSTIDLVVSSQFKFVKKVTLNYIRGSKTVIAFSKLQRVKADKTAFNFSRPSGIRFEVVR